MDIFENQKEKMIFLFFSCISVLLLIFSIYGFDGKDSSLRDRVSLVGVSIVTLSLALRPSAFLMPFKQLLKNDAKSILVSNKTCTYIQWAGIMFIFASTVSF